MTSQMGLAWSGDTTAPTFPGPAPTNPAHRGAKNQFVPTDRICRSEALAGGLTEGVCPAASPSGIWCLGTVSLPAGFQGISGPGILAPPTGPTPPTHFPAHCASSARRRRWNSLPGAAGAGARGPAVGSGNR